MLRSFRGAVHRTARAAQRLRGLIQAQPSNSAPIIPDQRSPMTCRTAVRHAFEMSDLFWWHVIAPNVVRRPKIGAILSSSRRPVVVRDAPTNPGRATFRHALGPCVRKA